MMPTVTQEQAQAAYQQWSKELNLTDQQKQQFSAALDAAVAQLDELAGKGEAIDSAQAKQVVRSSVEKWLTPEQLAVWDKGMGTARSFLGL
jgi:Spy/CpxP family protein refolding chaperone